MSIPFAEICPAPVTTSPGSAPPAAQSFFSDEAVLGEFDALRHRWTPGRGSDGRITYASWVQLPCDGRWIEVADSAFAGSIAEQLKNALPDYNDPGNNDILDILDDYCGIAHDHAGGRAFAHGGGHQGSANNGLYVLSLASMQWSIAQLPDMQTPWPASYTRNPPRDNSYTLYPPARDACRAAPDSTTFGDDEFFDPDTPAASTRHPTARHTYRAMTFDDGVLRHGVRRYWEWTEATGAWCARYPFGKTCATHVQPGGGYCGEAVKGTWDEVRRRYLCTPTQISGVPAGGWAYHADTGTFSTPKNLLAGWEAYTAVFARRDREWCSFARPTREGRHFPPQLKLWHLDDESLLSLPLTGLEQKKCIAAARYDESSVLEYVPDTGLFFLLMPYDHDGNRAPQANLPLEAFWIDSTQRTITAEKQQGAFPSLTSRSLINNKLFYSPKLNALVLIADASSPVRLRRFG